MTESERIKVARELIDIAKRIVAEPMNKEQALHVAQKHVADKIKLKLIEDFTGPVYGMNVDDYYIFRVNSSVPMVGASEYVAVKKDDASVVREFRCGG